MTHTYQHALDGFMAIYEGVMNWLGPIFVLLVLVIAIWMLLYGPAPSRRST